MSFTLNQLTEGIRQRHMGAQHQRLTEKWNRTGLLRGLQDQSRENMAVLLENQAAQVLREANTLGGTTSGTSGNASGDIRGFQNIAFPIVRRVFGGLVANDLVSIQPMSLPSGLLFYLDYTYGSSNGEVDTGSGTDAATYDRTPVPRDLQMVPNAVPASSFGHVTDVNMTRRSIEEAIRSALERCMAVDELRIRAELKTRALQVQLDHANKILAKEAGGLPKTRKRIAKLNEVAGALENRSAQIESYGSQLSALVKRANKKDETTEKDINISTPDSII